MVQALAPGLLRLLLEMVMPITIKHKHMATMDLVSEKVRLLLTYLIFAALASLKLQFLRSHASSGKFPCPDPRIWMKIPNIIALYSFLFLLTLFCQLALGKQHQKDKRYGPSPANNYTAGSGGGSFWSLRRRGHIT